MWATLSEYFKKTPETLSLENLRRLHSTLEQHDVVGPSNAELLIKTLREIAEVLIWGDQHCPQVFEFYLEKGMQLYFLRLMKQKTATTRIQVQLIQTLSILLENIRKKESVYYLLSNNHINEIITFKFDFSDEELLAYYVSFLKTVSLKLDQQIVQFFFDTKKNDFPLYTEAIKFFNSKESMIRIAVRTITLNTYRLEDAWVRRFILDRSAAPYFTNLTWFIRDQVITLAVELKGDASHVKDIAAELMDNFFYLNDILGLGIEELSVQLLRRLEELTQFLLGSLSPLQSDTASGTGSHASGEDQDSIPSTVAWHLLAQMMFVFTDPAMVNALASALLGSVSGGELSPSGAVAGDESVAKLDGHDASTCGHSHYSHNVLLSSMLDLLTRGEDMDALPVLCLIQSAIGSKFLDKDILEKAGMLPHRHAKQRRLLDVLTAHRTPNLTGYPGAEAPEGAFTQSSKAGQAAGVTRSRSCSSLNHARPVGGQNLAMPSLKRRPRSVSSEAALQKRPKPPKIPTAEPAGASDFIPRENSHLLPVSPESHPLALSPTTSPVLLAQAPPYDLQVVVQGGRASVKTGVASTHSVVGENTETKVEAVPHVDSGESPAALSGPGATDDGDTHARAATPLEHAAAEAIGSGDTPHVLSLSPVQDGPAQLGDREHDPAVSTHSTPLQRPIPTGPVGDSGVPPRQVSGQHPPPDGSLVPDARWADYPWLLAHRILLLLNRAARDEGAFRIVTVELAARMLLELVYVKSGQAKPSVRAAARPRSHPEVAQKLMPAKHELMLREAFLAAARNIQRCLRPSHHDALEGLWAWPPPSADHRSGDPNRDAASPDFDWAGHDGPGDDDDASDSSAHGAGDTMAGPDSELNSLDADLFAVLFEDEVINAGPMLARTLPAIPSAVVPGGGASIHAPKVSSTLGGGSSDMSGGQPRALRTIDSAFYCSFESVISECRTLIPCQSVPARSSSVAKGGRREGVFPSPAQVGSMDPPPPEELMMNSSTLHSRRRGGPVGAHGLPLHMRSPVGTVERARVIIQTFFVLRYLLFALALFGRKRGKDDRHGALRGPFLLSDSHRVAFFPAPAPPVSVGLSLDFAGSDALSCKILEQSGDAHRPADQQPAGPRGSTAREDGTSSGEPSSDRVPAQPALPAVQSVGDDESSGSVSSILAFATASQTSHLHGRLDDFSQLSSGGSALEFGEETGGDQRPTWHLMMDESNSGYVILVEADPSRLGWATVRFTGLMSSGSEAAVSPYDPCVLELSSPEPTSPVYLSVHESFLNQTDGSRSPGSEGEAHDHAFSEGSPGVAVAGAGQDQDPVDLVYGGACIGAWSLRLRFDDRIRCLAAKQHAERCRAASGAKRRAHIMEFASEGVV